MAYGSTRRSFRTLQNVLQALAAAPLAGYVAKSGGIEEWFARPPRRVFCVNRISFQTWEDLPRHFKLAFPL